MTLALVVSTALLPWPGRWALLKTIVPLALILVWARSGRGSLAALGLRWMRPRGRWLMIGFALALVLYAVKMFGVRPLARVFWPQPTDVSLFEPIKGNLTNLLVYLIFMWILAAFAEELIWRGFVMTRLAALGRDTRMAWLLALVASSAIFGSLHLYQGPRGVFLATISGAIYGVLFLASGRPRSLLLPIVVHGVGNTLSFVLIYFDLYERFVNGLVG